MPEIIISIIIKFSKYNYRNAEQMQGSAATLERPHRSSTCQIRSVSPKESCSSWRDNIGAVGNCDEEGAVKRKSYKLVAIPHFPAP